MNNSDMPAMPAGDILYHHQRGLTKREHFAAMAMQGILSNPSSEPTTQTHFDNIVEDALRATDTLLAKLEPADNE